MTALRVERGLPEPGPRQGGPPAWVTIGNFEYETRWRKAYPMLTLKADSKPVTFQYQPGAAQYNGSSRLDAIYAGAGAPSDYAGLDVKGKAAIIPKAAGIM